MNFDVTPSVKLSTMPGHLTPPPMLESQPSLNNNQRQALEVANKSAFGYFIPQDSNFGNLILPVIPRQQ